VLLKEVLAEVQVDCSVDLARRGLDTAEAEAVLNALEQTLRFLYEDLAREQERAGQ
jgi:23S rRNA G2069 N7-methylase RlmK/C1962 C5-methylase RlmI